MPNKLNIKLKLAISIFICLFLLNIETLFAQPDPTTGPTCWPPPCIPIDGGIGFLVAAGIAFGVKKTLDSKSKNAEKNPTEI